VFLLGLQPLHINIVELKNTSDLVLFGFRFGVCIDLVQYCPRFAAELWLLQDSLSVCGNCPGLSVEPACIRSAQPCCLLENCWQLCAWVHGCIQIASTRNVVGQPAGEHVVLCSQYTSSSCFLSDLVEVHSFCLSSLLFLQVRSSSAWAAALRHRPLMQAVARAVHA
jgi:hypothetical protein